MIELPELVRDLSAILLIAGLTTIICQKLKQPVILGYIIAGFFTGPNFTFYPTVTNTEIITNWSEIGIIVLLFALGLEFSFYKLKEIGGPAFIATFIIMLGVMALGFACGQVLGWNTMNCLFLGAMLSMSSTAIIAKNFETLQGGDTSFKEFVIGILVVEDIFSILFIVILTTIAKTHAIPEATRLLTVIAKLIFYLILWFVTGMYLIPTLFKKVRALANNETILVLALGLCFSMTVLVNKMGVSAALGAFMMGSFIAETPDIEKIQRLIAPIKDLFGAIFFVSVGMLVNPQLIFEHTTPIIAIIIVATLGKFIVAFLGSIIAGYNIDTSMRSSFSLAPIGEFSFIIASIGISYKVIESYLYPIIVTSAAITIFLAPYCLKGADKVSAWVKTLLPEKILQRIERYSKHNSNHDNSEWQKLLSDLGMRLLIVTVMLLAISLGANTYVEPYVNNILDHPYSNMVTGLISFIVMLPFLTMLLANKVTHPELFTTLWFKGRSNHLPLLILVLIKVLVATGFIYYFFIELLEASTPISIGATLIAIFLISTSNWLLGEYLHLESRFLININHQHLMNSRKKLNITKPSDSILLFDQQLFLAKYHIAKGAPHTGKALKDYNIRQWSGCNILQAVHKGEVVDMPSKDYLLKDDTTILIIGIAEQIKFFSTTILKNSSDLKELVPPISLRDFTADEVLNPPKSQFLPCAITIDNYSDLIGKSIMSTNIREEWHCMIIGIERGLYVDYNPNIATIFEKGDVLWVLGKQNMINKLVLDEVL